MLFGAAVCMGAIGWHGEMMWSWLPILFPFLYTAARTRMESCCALLYYLAATWPVVPGAGAFFAGKDFLLGDLALWMGISVLGAGPWILLYSRRWIEASALLSLFTLALPPLGLVTLAYPLTAAGFLFPGTKWIGLGFPAVVLVARRFIGWPSALVLITAAAGIAHLLYQNPTRDPGIVTVNTQFGGTAFKPPVEGAVVPPAVRQEMFIRKAALAHPRAVVLFPENSIPDWSQRKDAYWRAFFEQLEQQRTSVLIGTTIPIPNTSTASRNILLSRGFGPHFAYVQRVPVPLGMWQIVGDGRNGFPLMLIYPPSICVRNHRAAVLICYEQLIAWTALESLAQNPDFILAPSNLYWARETVIPAVQHEAIENWSALWGIPAYEASNR